MLSDAGLVFDVAAPDVDEAPYKREDRADAQVALDLARAKALSVSGRAPDALIVGSDSVISVEGRRFSKPADREEAAAHLRIFSGRTMFLTSAVALAQGGTVEWSVASVARLQVRALSEAFIQRYLDAEWPAVAYCVGVFRMEGPGVQLFQAIEGDYFTILGMPLLPLLAALRERGALES